MLIHSTLSDVRQQIAQQQDFVLNIIAAWCPDCVEVQAPRLPDFVNKLQQANLDVHQLLVQQEKRVFLDQQHQEFVDTLGGHGFPRTVLFLKGQAVDSDNVELIQASQLNKLASKFISQLPLQTD